MEVHTSDSEGETNKTDLRLAMTECKQLEMPGASVKGRRVVMDFNGGAVSSDAGLVLLRRVDERLGLTRRLRRDLADTRSAPQVRHEAVTMLRQRVLAVAAGYEDLNDAETLRHDLVHQSAAGTDAELASPATLCRFENQQDRAAAVAVNRALVETFIASFKTPPEELVLDFDATDDPIHGHQEGRFFHGYYDSYCFLPLYVFCGNHLLCAYLRKSSEDVAKHAGAILKLLASRLRQCFPTTRIIFRADSGFCRDKIMTWCDRHGVDYIIGVAKNERLLTEAEPYLEQAAELYQQTDTKARVFGGLIYGAKSWTLRRHVIAKAEYDARGANPRFIVTSLDDDAKTLYERLYCARGDMENRIKEQLQLFSDRTSAHCWWANQWRVCLSALAYTLMEGLRRLALEGTELARAQCASLRLELLKVGAVITRNTRRIHLRLPSAYPLQNLWRTVLERLATG